MATEDALIPLKRVKGGGLNEDSTGFASKKLVWFRDADGSSGFCRGSVKETNGTKVTVEQEGNHRRHELNEMDIDKVNPPKFDQSEDMAELPNLNEAAVLYNLQDRYASNLIHTYSGLFVVIVNPFQRLPIYTDDVINAYKGRRREDRPPHIFAVADQAYRDMMQLNEDQSILCTGESGAGKTENTKKVIQYLAHIAASGGKSGTRQERKAAQVAQSRRRTVGLVSQTPDLERGQLENQLLRANPILETFGNAATTRNDNSSRFGKFIRIHFNKEGFIMGASIETYLLEKSRVVTQADGERSFHAPYQLLKGAPKELRQELLLDDISTYKFIASKRHDLEEIDDLTEWGETNEAFKVYGMSPEEIKDVWRIVASVLTFGQLEFEDGKGDSHQATLTNDAMCQKVAQLFGVNPAALTKSLTKPRIKAGTETVQRAQSKEQVDLAVKAIAKSIYEKLFLWMVQRINSSLDQAKGRGKQFIGILDIAGFEIFEQNSFEQLLINFTNEKLQQLFNRRMFVMEQDEYKREGIEWDFIDFGLDLQPTIDCISGRQGLIPMLDEQSIFPKATDQTLVQKYEQVMKGTDSYVKTHLKMKGDFAVKHYAGDVVYSVDGWLFKNRDPLNDNVVALLKDSSNPFMKTLWTSSSPVIHSARQRGTMRTVAGVYMTQLKELMETLEHTTPNFVRCIKPNHLKKPGIIQPQLILDQLRCGGVLEGIRIVRKGFPNRVLYQDFRQRYQLLCPGAIPKGFVDSAKATEHMTEALDLDPSEFRLGQTKIFFRTGVLSRLEEERDAVLSKMLVGLQAYCRGKLARLAFRFHVGDHQAVGVIQRNVRAYMTLRNWPWWRLYCKIKPMLKELAKRNMQQELEATIAHLKEQLEAEIATRKQFEDEASALKDQVARLTEELEFERESVNDLETELQTKERQIKEWEEELEVSDQKLDEVMEAQKRLLKEKRELVDQIEALKDDLAQGSADQAHIERLEKEKTDLQDKLLEAEDALAVKAKAAKTLETQVVELKASIEETEGQLSTAEKARAKASNEVEDLLAQIDELTTKGSAAQKKLKQHAQDLEREAARTQAVSEELATTTGRLHKSETKVIQLEAEVADATEKIAQLEKDKKQLKKDLQDLSATDDLEARVNSLQAQLRTRETELDELNEECDTINDSLAKIEREKAALEVRLHQLEAQKMDEDAMSGPKVKKLKAQLAELQDELESQGARASKLFNEKKRLEVELKTVQGDLEEETNLRKKDVRTIAKLQKKLAFLSGESEGGGGSAEEVEKLKSKNKELREALEEEEDKNATLATKKRRALRDLEEKTELVTTLEKEVESLRAKVRRYRQELATHETDISTVSVDADDVEA
eukprot:m.161964 g.161964  ORF g.161964 m.161964 type:complete len:1355 (+) comp12131_c0_seq1:60-4124(+)